jgi:Fe-S cluster biogenesis protein NfuA/nitrite reductase/ring-hydroxylating ferredoxin subunit
VTEAATETAVVPPDPRSTGKRIEALLDASGSDGPLARERSEELVRLVVDLYGAGLERLLELVDEAGRLDEDLLDRLADDDLVASLLLVSGLHPYSAEERVARALDSVRPYLGSHGGDVELLEITGDGVVRLRMLGSCDGCPSSSVTLELAVSEAIEAAAPELTGIEVEEPATAAAPPAGVIPVEALRSRVADQPPAAGAATRNGAVREVVDGLPELADGGVHPLVIGGVPILVCRWRESRYAYRDRCPSCGSPLAGDGPTSLIRGLGTGAPLLTCPGCTRHFDVVRAGAGIEPGAGHLDPFPLLERDGRIEIRVPGLAEEQVPA